MYAKDDLRQLQASLKGLGKLIITDNDVIDALRSSLKESEQQLESTLKRKELLNEQVKNLAPYEKMLKELVEELEAEQ